MGFCESLYCSILVRYFDTLSLVNIWWWLWWWRQWQWWR